MERTFLARIRGEIGLSQRELARRAGVPQSTVGRIEAGLLDPRIGTVERLLRACGMDLAVVPDRAPASTAPRSGSACD